MQMFIEKRSVYILCSRNFPKFWEGFNIHISASQCRMHNKKSGYGVSMSAICWSYLVHVIGWKQLLPILFHCSHLS